MTEDEAKTKWCCGPPMNTMADTTIADLQAEIDRLNAALHWEQHRAGREGTHSDNCHTWGPQHYECALREIARQRGVIETWREAHIDATGADQ